MELQTTDIADLVDLVSDSTVEYIDHMGDDLTVVNAARVSFAKHKNEFDSGDEKLIKYLATHNHWTPFAHCQIQLRITAPIFVARQLVKHQIGLVWNEESRRYIDSPPAFYMPTAWRGRASNKKQGSSDEIINVNPELLKSSVALAMANYQFLLNQGVCPEQARMVLPLNMMTTWYWTGSLLAFARVCVLRLDAHAQKETQRVAQQINGIMEELYPVSWAALVTQAFVASMDGDGIVEVKT